MNIIYGKAEIRIVITPFALAKISEDLYIIAGKYTPEDHIPFINYFLYLVSIERGFKAAILSKNCTKENKNYIKKNIGHDLEKVYLEFKKIFDLDLFTQEEETILKNINKLYKEKGFEYFSTVMFDQMLQGFKDLPKLEEIYEMSKKVNQFIINNNYFRNSIRTAIL